MKTTTLVSKIHKAFSKAGFNVGPLTDVTLSFTLVSSYRFLMDKSFSCSYKNTVRVYTSHHTGKTYLHVYCDVEDYNKILTTLTPFVNVINFSVDC